MTAKQWRVVGGADKGGILVREGQELQSSPTADRLSTGAVLEELELAGERLNYRLLSGTGPSEGWVSLKVSSRALVEPIEDLLDAVGGPGAGGGPVAVDAGLKAKIEAASAKSDFSLYCMKYKTLGYPLAEPKLRIFCFHTFAGAEAQYTGPGTAVMAWAAQARGVEICALDYPGRNRLLKATKHTSTETLAPELLAASYAKLADGVPYVVWAHSVGTWVAFEFLMLCRKVGLPMPLAGFFMAFPAPHLPETQRPWRRSARLSDGQMKEEVMNWDRAHFQGDGRNVFDQPAWRDVWEPLLRAELRLFDEYRFGHDGAPRFPFPIHAWHFDGETCTRPEMVGMWRDWTDSDFEYSVMKGMGHLTCFYKSELKKQYFHKVTSLIRGYVELN